MREARGMRREVVKRGVWSVWKGRMGERRREEGVRRWERGIMKRVMRGELVVMFGERGWVLMGI